MSYVSAGIQQPMDLLLGSIGKKVYVRCRAGRELRGTLHSVDEHLNLMMSGVNETNGTANRNMPMLFIRGDGIIGISPIHKQ